MVRKHGGRKRARGTTRAPIPAAAPQQRWSLDFVSDQLACGRRFRILAIFDDCTRECLGAAADTSLSGRRLARELDRRARQAPNCCQRQRGADQQRHSGLGRSNQGRLALHCTEQADAERLRRKLQRSPARRVSERNPVQVSHAGPPGVGRIATRLQRCAASFVDRLAGGRGLCHKLLTAIGPRSCAR
jgi:hypothetical protein